MSGSPRPARLKSPLRTLCYALFLGLMGCASATVSGTWKNERYVGGPVQRVLVLGVASDAVSVRLYEKETVERFREAGVQAVAARDHFPDDRKLTEAEIQALARQEELSHLLVTTVREVRKATEKRTYITGDVWYPYGRYPYPYPYPTRPYPFPSWYPYYSDAWLSTRAMQTVTTYTYYIIDLEMNLYEVATGMLAWTTVLEAMHHESIAATVRSINRAAFQELRKSELLP